MTPMRFVTSAAAVVASIALLVTILNGFSSDVAGVSILAFVIAVITLLVTGAYHVGSGIAYVIQAVRAFIRRNRFGSPSNSQRLFPAGAGALLDSAAGLLPGPARARYGEEWRGELYDLRAEGARWRRWVGYVARIVLFTAPVLAVTLRLYGIRATD